MRVRLKIWLSVVAFLMLSSYVFAVEPEVDRYQSQGQRNPQWDDAVISGFKEYEAANYNNAISFLEKAYKAGCRDGLVLYRLAYCYYFLERCSEVCFYGEQALFRLRDNHPQHYYNQTIYEILARCSDDNKAVEYYLKTLTFHPSDVGVRLNLSRCLIKLDRLKEAEDQINIVLNEYPQVTSPYGYSVAYGGLGRIYYKKGDYHKAADFFKKALGYSSNEDDKMWLELTNQALRK